MKHLLGRIWNRAGDLAFMPGTGRLWARRLRGQVLCLVYHRVDQPKEDDFLRQGGVPVIGTDQLARELGFLAALDAQFLTFADLLGGRFPEPRRYGVIVSFDDCFRDTYDNALPVLEALGIHGVFFQTSGMLDFRALLWEHALYWYSFHPRLAKDFRRMVLKRFSGDAQALLAMGDEHGVLEFLRFQSAATATEALLADFRQTYGEEDEAEIARTIYPDAAQVREARRRGHEIGSHGHYHYPRATIDKGLFEQELATSSSRLAEAIGEPIGAFSYPFNSRLPGDEEICGRYFNQAATVDAQLITRDSPPLCLPRYTWPDHPGPFRTRRWLLTGRN